METYTKDRQYIRFCLYGFLKNLRFYDSFLLIFFLEHDISFSQIGILYAVREIFTNIFEVPSGIIADVYGRKNSLLAAFFLYILSFIVFYFSRSFYFLFIAMVLVGVSDAFRSGTHKGMIMDYLKLNNWEKFKVDYYGHTRSWSQKGSAISALLAGLMVFYSGNYKIVYLVSIFPYLLNFINIYTYPKALNYSDKNKEKKLASLKLIIVSIYSSLKQKQVLRIVNSSALHSAYLKSIKDYIQPLMINIAVLIPLATTMGEKSKNGVVIGVFYFFIFLMTSYASKSSGKVLKLQIHRIEQKTLLTGLLAGSFVGLLYYGNYWVPALVIFVSIFIIENLRKPILTGFLADKVSNNILTSVISVQSFYSTIVTAGISLIIGLLAEHFGIGIALMATSLILIILTILIEKRGAKSRKSTDT